MDLEVKKKITRNWFKVLQEVICKDIEEIEKKKNIFKIKNWKRNLNKEEGGGEFRIFKNGKVFEKVGVNYSEVFGKFSKQIRNKSGVMRIIPLFCVQQKLSIYYVETWKQNALQGSYNKEKILCEIL